MKNKDKYDLNTLKIEWTPQTSERRYFSVKIKHNKKSIFSKEMKPSEIGTSAYNAWLEEEYDPKILTDKEKAYLSAVIKPFREEIETIKKTSFSGYEQLQISDGCTIMEFPCFEKDTMYKGMEAYKEYTLEDLGL